MSLRQEIARGFAPQQQRCRWAMDRRVLAWRRHNGPGLTLGNEAAIGIRGEEVMNYLRRDLKVCEGCGGLWVRTGEAAGVYCRHCGPRMAELPVRRKVRPGRPCRASRVSNMEQGGAR